MGRDWGSGEDKGDEVTGWDSWWPLRKVTGLPRGKCLGGVVEERGYSEVWLLFIPRMVEWVLAGAVGILHTLFSSFLPPGAGILAMANAGPDTNGSQFFVTLAPTQWLDGKHTIFGRVCQGIGMVNRVGMVETNSQDRPVDDVKIIKAYPSG